MSTRRAGHPRRTYHLGVAAANEPPGSANGRAPGRPGPRGTAAEKHRRDLAIYRAQLRGRSAADLARDYDVGGRQAREVVRQMREAADPTHDPSPEEIIARVLLAIEDALGEKRHPAGDLVQPPPLSAAREHIG